MGKNKIKKLAWKYNKIIRKIKKNPEEICGSKQQWHVKTEDCQLLTKRKKYTAFYFLTLEILSLTWLKSGSCLTIKTVYAEFAPLIVLSYMCP